FGKSADDRCQSSKLIEAEQACSFLALVRDRHGLAKTQLRLDRAPLLTRSDWRPLTRLDREYLLLEHRSRFVGWGVASPTLSECRWRGPFEQVARSPFQFAPGQLFSRCP